MMRLRRMWFVSLAVASVLSYPCGAKKETLRLKDGDQWQAVAANPQEQYLHALAEIKELVREGDEKALKAAFQQLKGEFPDRVGPDLELFLFGELRYWQERYDKALVKYEKLLKEHPGSEYAAPTMEREFDIAHQYLQGRKKTILAIIRVTAFEEGIEIMERISDRAGLDEPNGVGLKAAIAVAEHYEGRQRYHEAYLKWSEIASYWEKGPVGKRALYRMAENNLAAYNQPPARERWNFDASKLATARTYYERFLSLYPAEGRENGIPEKIRQIDEQVAHKQFRIGQYYRRTGEHQAAHLYFDMVVQNWPGTEAAALARQAMAEGVDGEQAGGK